MGAAVLLTMWSSPARAGEDLLWDNELTPNGVNGRGLSPPDFPGIRVVDDMLTELPSVISAIHANVIEDDGWWSNTCAKTARASIPKPTPDFSAMEMTLRSIHEAHKPSTHRPNSAQMIKDRSR